MAEPDDTKLQALFADLKAPKPSDALMSRVLEDAYTLQPAPLSDAQETPHSRWSAVVGLFGGWGGLGGLAFATCVGFVFGLSPPDLLSTPLDTVFGMDLTETYDASSGSFGFGWDLEEG